MFKAYFICKLLSNIQSDNERGFTLIELLVTVVIIGLLAAVALPSLLNQGNITREATARAVLGAINRSQQAYRFTNGTFATNLAALQIGEPGAEGYMIDISGMPDATMAQAEATPDNAELSAFCGFATASSDNNVATTQVSISEGGC